MGEECSTCKRCSDQDEIRAETSITANPLIAKDANSIIKDKSHKTSQKSTNHTIPIKLPKNQQIILLFLLNQII